MNLTDRTKNAVIWTFGSIVVQAILQLLVTSILAHFIPPDEFGLFAIASLIIGVISIFAQIGVGPTIIQKKELSDQFLSNTFLLSFILGIIGFVLTWAFAPLLANLFHQPKVTNLIRIEGLILIFSGYTTVATSLLQRDLHFRKVAIINVSSYAIGYGLIGCSLAVIRVDVWAIIGASISQNVIIALILLFTTQRIPKLLFSKKEIKELLSFSTGVSVAQIFANISYYVDNAIVGRFLGTTALGLYQMAFQIMDLPRRFLGNVIDQILFVVMSKIQDNQDQMRGGYLQSLEIANLLMVPITVFMIISAPEIVSIILGDQWQGAILPLQILLIQIPFRTSIRMADSIGTAAGKVHPLARLKILSTILMGIAAFIGIYWGLVGVSITISIAIVIMWIIMIRFTFKITNTTIQEYFHTWVSGLLIGFTVAILISLCRYVLIQISISMIFILIFELLITIISFIFTILLFPKIIGMKTIRLALDFGKSLPVLSSFFIWIEKKFFKSKLASIQINN